MNTRGPGWRFAGRASRPDLARLRAVRELPTNSLAPLLVALAIVPALFGYVELAMAVVVVVVVHRVMSRRSTGQGTWGTLTAVVAVGLLVLVVTDIPLVGVVALLVPPILLSFSARRDAASVLSVHAALLLLLPATLIVGPLGASGTPANLVGIGAFCWWAASRMSPTVGGAHGHQPLHVALMLLALAALASLAALYTRPYALDELSASNRGILVLLGGAGVALLASDGITDFARLDRLLRRLVTVAAVVAGVGVLQFFTGANISSLFHIPGLVANNSFGAISSRSIFRRVEATATHPIEFGVVLAVVLPLALNQALAERERRGRAWIKVILIASAVPMSVSRSGMLGLVIGSVVVACGWTWAQRRTMLGRAVVFAVAMRLLIPGLLGTVKSLFMNIGDDPSTTGRTDDYVVVGRFFSEAPWTGRGLYTFLPDRYTTFDNQYLGTLVEMGIFGLLALTGLLLVGYFTARGARRRSSSPALRDTAQALAASSLVALATFATFDALSFPMITGLTFLILGCAGAAWRIARDEADEAASAAAAGRPQLATSG